MSGTKGLDHCTCTIVEPDGTQGLAPQVAQIDNKEVGKTAGAFHPKIIAFCCYYCAYSAADLAGSLRIQYPPTVRLIEQPCSGKVDIRLLLQAFEDGADGVYVAGCLEGDCHFLKGNIRAKKRVNAAKKILDKIGVGGERLEMFNLSGSMGPRFAEIATEMSERILRLGPSPLNQGRRDVREEGEAE